MLSKTYSPQEIEDKWSAYWLSHKLFASKPNPDKEPFTIVIPPPNVTGVLHMGHMLNNTIQDILTRKARMEGKEACWVPGTDHASIATEAKVVAMLKERGIKKHELTREQFLEYAWEWKEKYGGIILEQLKKLGASCDWDRTSFTMDPDYYDSVIDVFIDLYNKGYIYRGVRMVNWDPQAKTSLSDEEVIMKEIQQKLCYIKYEVVKGQNQSAIENPQSEFVTIATVRPETIMADVAICVHPDDERYKHLHGKKVLIPLINREIPIITDEYVEMDFGTGALKITPAHDRNDYELGKKHGLPTIDLLNEDGTLNDNAQIYVGLDRFAARKAILKELEEKGYIEKIEDYKSNVGTSERTEAVIEPRLSLQWFMSMKELAEPALENVENDNIKFYPPKFKNMYRTWMENIQDWCVSRQLWWGHRIPAFYLKDGTIIVAKNKREALRKAQHEKLLFALCEEDLEQDPDVLDTWASSWLWPMAVFKGWRNPEDEEIKYYYPTNDLVTAPEIIFFWVARMIMAGYFVKNELPFRNVYFTGIVRDKLGRKMSKSLGNSPDPLELMAKYGADGVRMGMMISSPAGNDLPFDEKYCEQGRNFCNKIWNAYRLISGWEVAEGPAQTLAIEWFESKLNVVLSEVQDHFSKFRISDALQTVYKLIWDDFCSQYLEIIKPAYGQPIDKETFEATIHFFERLMCLLHPFMPFITEELWQNIRERQDGESICRAEFPKTVAANEALLADFERMFEVVTKVREIRNSKQISPKQELPLTIKSDDSARYQALDRIIQKLANTLPLQFVSEKVAGATSFLVKTDEFFVNLAGELDAAAETERLTKELEYQVGFKKSVEAKLSNERFVQNAKADIVEKERQKLADAEAKIKSLEEALSQLK
ncbi:MAG: valine--tRNA ligase [Spirosomataceae bacterium]